jgi:hypothetical protein
LLLYYQFLDEILVNVSVSLIWQASVFCAPEVALGLVEDVALGVPQVHVGHVALREDALHPAINGADVVLLVDLAHLVDVDDPDAVGGADVAVEDGAERIGPAHRVLLVPGERVPDLAFFVVLGAHRVRLGHLVHGHGGDGGVGVIGLQVDSLVLLILLKEAASVCETVTLSRCESESESV